MTLEPRACPSLPIPTRSHVAGTVAVLPARSGTPIHLEPGEWEVVTIVPLKRPAGKGGTAFAAIGLASMLNSGGAVLNSEVVPKVLSTSVNFPGASAADRGAEAGASSGGAYWNSSARVVEWIAKARSPVIFLLLSRVVACELRRRSCSVMPRMRPCESLARAHHHLTETTRLISLRLRRHLPPGDAPRRRHLRLLRQRRPAPLPGGPARRRAAAGPPL